MSGEQTGSLERTGTASGGIVTSAEGGRTGNGHRISVRDPHHFLLLLWSLQVFKISELLSQMLGPASFMTVIETQVPRKAEGILSEIIFYLPVFAGHYTARSNAQAFVN